MDVSEKVRALSAPGREMLIQHVAGNVPIVRARRSRHIQNLGRARLTLIRLGLIAKVPGLPRPKATTITAEGREAAAILLAGYADALVLAGWLEEEERPLAILRRLKAERWPDPSLPGPVSPVPGPHKGMDE